MNIRISILLILNLISFCLYFIDKRKAIKNKQRISEKTLLLSAFLFGSIGAIVGMYLCRHKTKKLKFTILVPLFLLLHLYIFIKLF